MRGQLIILLAVAAAAAGAGYLMSRNLQPGAGDAPAPFAAPPPPQATDLLGRRRPDFTLEDASGTLVSVGDFDGKVLLVNFWASWCRPCVEEMPMLSDLQRDHAGSALQVIGIALDDPQRAQAFAADLTLEYPLLFGLADAARVGREYGNGGGMLPYSVLVDSGGIIRWNHLGALTRDGLEELLSEVR